MEFRIPRQILDEYNQYRVGKNESNKYFEEEKVDFFNNVYFKLLVNRVSNSVMSVETDLGDANAAKNAVRLNDCMVAFEELINNSNTELSEDLIIDVANRVNASNMFISNGYRKIGDYLADTHISISEPSMIKHDMERLLYMYNNSWKELNYLKREALFHIEFIRIHPFEDGNGRTSRLLLNYNLLRQGYAPIIIISEMLDTYFECIKNKDVKKLTKLFYQQSELELNVINELYNRYLYNKELVSGNHHHR